MVKFGLIMIGIYLIPVIIFILWHFETPTKEKK